MSEVTLKVPPEAREALLFAELDQAMETMEGTAEAMLELRDIHRSDNRERVVGDLRGYIETARGDLAAVETLLDGEAA
jgi:hypothetical protein